MEILHNSQDIKYRSPFGAVQTGSVVRLRLCVYSSAQPEEVLLRVWQNGEEVLHKMSLEDKSDGFVYGFSLKTPDKPCLIWYYFVVCADGERCIYANNAERLGGVGRKVDAFEAESYQITVYDKDFKTPEWFRGRIMYQIFPDRFFGEQGSEIFKKRDEYIIHYDTGEKMSNNRHPYEDGPAYNDFYGGNLRGIIAKLPYIKSLGVGVIYLNPIFEAYSNHRYDTADYKKIDPMLGTEEDFKELCEKAEKMDIRIILDGVFSHTGSDSIYFNKYRSYGDGGAYNDENSPYRSWYSFGEGKSYESWWGCSNLPNVNEMDDSYLDYILRDEDSVIKKWLRLGASGWRLDVADELPDEFIEILRTEAKKVKEDAVIIGEVWEDASNKVAYSKQRKYLLGAELDSVMNYPFKDNVTAFLMGRESAEELDRRLMSIAENYPLDVRYSLMNLVGTHDTMRIKSLLGDLGENCGEERLSSGMESLATYRLICTMFMQMTFVGVPSVYYGDEIGMQGGKDPFNRGYFTWRNIDIEPLEACRSFAKARNTLGVLKSGLYKTLYANDGVIVYARYFEKGKDAFGNKGDGSFAICAVNRSFEPQRAEIDVSDFEFGKLYMGMENSVPVTAENGKLILDIPPVGYTFIYSGKKL